MDHSVVAGVGGKSLGYAHHQLGIAYRHVGKKLVIGERVLHAALFVGDNGERRDLRARARGGRDSDEVRLLAHLRELVNALAYIHKAHGEVGEVDFGMLVQHPHNLARVERTAAAERDDSVGIEAAHGFRALLRRAERRVGLNIGERRVDDAHLVEPVADELGKSALEQELVGDDEHALFAHVFKLLERDGHTTLFEVHLFGRAEPQHILSPFSDGFIV